MKVLDLTHPFATSMPVWPNDPPVSISHQAEHDTYGYYLNKVSFGEHSGTHIGAPVHFNAGSMAIDRIPPSDLIVPGVVIDISDPCQNDRDYLLTTQDIADWESKHSPIPVGCVVLVKTGWSVYWHHPEKYLGQERNQLHFPGISASAARTLLERQITGIGIDTHGIDGGLLQTFAVNKMMAENGVYHLENLAIPDVLPATGFTLFVGALPIANGSGSPCRVLAQLPN